MRHSVEVSEGRQARVQRLRWRSRRGMLELELALKPFVERALDTLDDETLAAYSALLEHDDWDIFDWVQGRSEPDDAALAGVVGVIRTANTPG